MRMPKYCKTCGPWTHEKENQLRMRLHPDGYRGLVDTDIIACRECMSAFIGPLPLVSHQKSRRGVGIVPPLMLALAFILGALFISMCVKYHPYFQ